MANEITLNLVAKVVNGNLSRTFAPGSISVDQTTAVAHHPVIAVGTSEEVISFGDITTLGYVAFRNLSSSNFVTIGPESGGAMVGFMRLEAGEVGVLRLEPGITVRAQADTATVNLEMMALDN